MRAIAIVVIAGCGRISFDPFATSDAGGEDAASDTPVDLPSNAIVATFGEAPGTTVSGVTIDTMISGTTQDQNFGTALELGLGASRVIVLRFAVVAIPTTATVVSSKLTIATTTLNTPGTLRIHEVLEEWDEGTGNATNGIANFNLRKPGVSWTTPGVGVGSRSAGTSGAFNLVAADSVLTSAVTPDLVQTWISSAAMNRGIALVITGGDASLASSESLELTHRPVLEVTYVP